MPWLTREEGATKGSRGEERAAKGSKEEKVNSSFSLVH